MKEIEGKLYSPHLKPKNVWFPAATPTGFELKKSYNWTRNGASVSKIRQSDGYPVNNFRKLIEEVAIVTLYNKEFEMFYRGQNFDYKDSQTQKPNKKLPQTIIYPSICRPEKSENGAYKFADRSKFIEKRYLKLYDLANKFSGGRTFSFEENFALFQHYNIIPTPLIDITQSLRVAATFALKGVKIGYLYVFGLPYPNQSISHFIDLGIVLLKLQNICPVEALRPRYQEGYLVGKYPFNFKIESNDNLARRLVAKFKLDNSNDNFWDNSFSIMPDEVLFPKNDPMEESFNKFLKS